MPRKRVPQLGPRKGSVFLKSRWRRGMGSESSERITMNKMRTVERWCRVDQKTPRKLCGMSVSG